MYYDLYEELNVVEKIIFKIFKRYSIKIYKIGVKTGYNWKCWQLVDNGVKLSSLE